jgi:hypothetical protein
MGWVTFFMRQRAALSNKSDESTRPEKVVDAGHAGLKGAYHTVRLCQGTVRAALPNQTSPDAAQC